jgi:hypothetical protein
VIKCAHCHENVRVGVDAPLTQSFFAYLLLTLVYVPIVLRRRQKLQVSMAAWVNSGNCWSVAIHSSHCFEYSCSADSLVPVPSPGVHWCTGQLSWWVQAPRSYTESREVLLTTTDNRLKTICCSCQGIPILLHHQCNFVGLLDCCMGHHTHLVRTGHKVFFLAVCRGRDMCGRACPCAPFRCGINRGAR